MIRTLPVLGILAIAVALDWLLPNGGPTALMALGALAGCLLSGWLGRRGPGWPVAMILVLTLGAVALWGLEDISFRRRLFLLMQLGQAFLGAWLLLEGRRNKRRALEWAANMNAALVVITLFASAMAFHLARFSAGYALSAAWMVLAAVQLDLVPRRQSEPVRLAGWAGSLRLMVALLTAMISLVAAGLLAPPLAAAGGNTLGRLWRDWRDGNPPAGDEEGVDGSGAGTVNVGGHEIRSGGGDGRGPRKPPHVAVAWVRATDEASTAALAARPFYLRLGAFDQLSNRTWRISMSRAELEDSDDGREDGAVTVRSLPGPVVNYAVCTRVTRQTLLPGIPVLLAIHSPAASLLGNDTLASPVEIRERYFCFSATSRLFDWMDVAGMSSELGEIDARYMRLPTGRLAEVVEQEVTGIPGLKMGSPEAIPALVNHLRASCRYSLETANAPDRHPIEHFLLLSRSGHCELFASSFVLMARAAGLPARFCLGYCGGEYDPRSRLFAFYADDAHAWAEVYFENHGWLTVDPTPPGVPGSPAPPRTAPGRLQMPRDQMPWLDELVALDRDPLLGSGRFRAGGRWVAEYSGPIMALGLGASLVMIVILAVARRRPPATGAGRLGIVRSRLPDFLTRFLRFFAARGVPIQNGQTLREYVRTLRDSGALAKEYDDLIQYAHDVLYDERLRSPERERAFLKRLKD